jgi:hypothetical protein
MHNERSKVTSALDQLSEMPYSERKAAFRSLPANLKDDVWLAHLERFMVEHNDLNDDERSVIYEAIGVLATGPSSLDRMDRDWEIKVGRPMRQLEIRANMLCRWTVLRSAFYVLGPDTPKSLGGVASGRGAPRLPRIQPLTIYDCECNVNHDFCGGPESPVVCAGSRCNVTSSGCGWFFFQECNGNCT